MNTLDESLSLSVIKAIADPSCWDQVLLEIMTATGAKAAMITLRDNHTCQIVNDLALLEKHHSARVQGFDDASVAFYLKELRTDDPWAEVQRTHFPYRTTPMSKHCSIDSKSENPFFQWLKSTGIRDTIVFALDHVPGHWTACNLFFESDDPKDQVELLAYAERHFNLLRDAWKVSQKQIRMEQASSAMFDQMDKIRIPACITDEHAKVIRSNISFDALAARGIAKTSGPHNKLSLCRDILWVDDKIGFATKASYHGFADEPADIAATSFEPDPLHSGQRDPLWLVTFGIKGEIQPDDIAMAFDLQKLDVQEKDLFEQLRTHSKVPEAGEKIGLGRTRSFEIWAQIRSKLDIASIHQIQR